MNTYMIDGAIERTEYGPKVDFSEAYINEYCFHAESDAQAFALVERMQEEHDNNYFKIGAELDDIANAPSYSAALYRLDEEGEAVKVL